MSGSVGNAKSLVIAPELMGARGLLHFAMDPLGAFSTARSRYGDAVAFTQLRGHYVLLSHPEGVEAVLHHKGGEFQKDFFTRDLGTILGQGLLNAEGDLWRRRRKLMAPTFQPRELAAFGDTMLACTDELLRSFAPDEVRDLHADAMHLALDIVVRTLFGAKLERFDDVERAIDVVTTEYRLLWHTWRAMIPRWVPLPSHARLARVRAELDAILLEVIEQKRRAPGKDLLSRLLALTDDEGQGLTDREVRDEAMTLFLAGHETTALGLTYTFRLLATHPEIDAKVMAELDTVLGGRAPTQADLERLPYTSAMVRESLRLYPPVWAMGRFAIEAVEVAGITVPQGTHVLMSQWVVQRDARWFPEPEQFRPERWLSGETASLHRFAYFPFGGGPRVCVGQHFALLELVLVVARMLQKVRFETAPGEGLALGPVVTLRPRGPVRLRVVPRRGSSQRTDAYRREAEISHA
jgi:cytochrome P450